MMSINKRASAILLSTYAARNTSGEDFIADHLFSYQIAGSLRINDGKKYSTFNQGSFRLGIRNKLAKYVKQPPVVGKYQSLSVVFDQQFLRAASIDHHCTPGGYQADSAVLQLKPDPLYQNYFSSVMPFLPFTPQTDREIVDIKLKEALYIILRIQPELCDILFDFSDPFKIDIESYMEDNFRFNLSMNRFAYLTGRSISTFKRDFYKQFGTTPGRWLLYRRLREAFFLMKENGRTASDVYLEVGFEDLSHFSRSFKTEFGFSPSRLI